MKTAVASLILLATLCTASGSHPAARKKAATVTIDNFHFIPANLTVARGTTVTWTNDDDEPHTVVSVRTLFRSPALDTGDRFTYTFATKGSYRYFCSVHPMMTGTVAVR